MCVVWLANSTTCIAVFLLPTSFMMRYTVRFGIIFITNRGNATVHSCTCIVDSMLSGRILPFRWISSSTFLVRKNVQRNSSSATKVVRCFFSNYII